jgi:hypothetical protein
VESFFATLKNEMYHRQTFATRARARFAVAEYIEAFYNRRRLHSTARLPNPVRGAHRLPHRGNRRGVIKPEDLSKILDTAQPALPDFDEALPEPATRRSR